ncbi:peptidase family M48-domain-containing protein [Phlyctochytrium arcticum]|nr:peptidase family M48-domain-containing protein [Phlyctochytrium arcticum]
MGVPLADGVAYKEYVLGFSWIVYLWSTYLNYRQHKKLLEPRLPAAMKAVVKDEDFLKARAYGLDKSRFGFVSDAFDQVQSTVIIAYDFLPWFWAIAGNVLAKRGYGPEYEIAHSIVFVAILTVFGMVLGLPFSLYSTFVIEERHGFNKQTLRLFFTDMLKETLLSAAIGIPVIVAFLKIIDWAGSSFYYYVWLFVFTFQIIMMIIFPTFIQPLFNKFTPLEDGELKTKIDALASRIKFPLTKLFVIDGSKRSAHSNAYFYGFFKNKRIVLYDTLLEHSTTDEVCAVLAHELGHWQFNHVLQMLVMIQFHLFSIFFLFSSFVNHVPLYRSFGFQTQPVLIGFTLFQYIILPAETILSFLQNMLSRKNEFQADAFAKKLGYASLLKSALVKLQVENKGNMNPDKWYSAWHYSHPPLIERLNAIGKTE